MTTKKTAALTLGELAAIEDYADMPLSALEDPSAKKMKLMIAIAWYVMKRDNPAATINEAEALTSDELTALMEKSGISSGE